MTDLQKDKEKKWLIKLVQDRYAWLSLTPEQADLIFRYERDIEKGHSENFIPSFWEEKEIERHFFKQALTEEQFKLYQKQTARQIKSAEADMVESDKAVIREIAYQEKLLQFYKEDLVVKFIQHKYEYRVGFLPNINRRIEFLKDEYNEYLQGRLREVCVSHFRYARDFQPNQFKVELLRHEIEKVLPSYFFFEKTADSGVKETARFLISKMPYEFGLFNTFLDGISRRIEDTTDKLYREFHEETQTPAAFVIKLDGDLSEAQRKENEFLSYLLMDSEKYGWQ